MIGLIIRYALRFFYIYVIGSTFVTYVNHFEVICKISSSCNLSKYISYIHHTLNPSLVLVQPSKTRPYITKRLLMGRKESNQTKQKSSYNCGSDSTSCRSVLNPTLFINDLLLSDIEFRKKNPNYKHFIQV